MKAAWVRARSGREGGGNLARAAVPGEASRGPAGAHPTHEAGGGPPGAAPRSPSGARRYATTGAGAPAARRVRRVASDASGGISLYITGVTRRASSVLDTSPPMITLASGE